MAVYLGHSPDHATNALVVLNTRTGLVSPQYHVVFDDDFTTTKSLKTDTLPTNWKVLFPSLSTCLDDAQAITHTLADEWQDPSPLEAPSHPPLRPRIITFIDEKEQRELLSRSPSFINVSPHDPSSYTSTSSAFPSPTHASSTKSNHSVKPPPVLKKPTH